MGRERQDCLNVLHLRAPEVNLTHRHYLTQVIPKAPFPPSTPNLCSHAHARALPHTCTANSTLEHLNLIPAPPSFSVCLSLSFSLSVQTGNVFIFPLPCSIVKRLGNSMKQKLFFSGEGDVSTFFVCFFSTSQFCRKTQTQTQGDSLEMVLKSHFCNVPQKRYRKALWNIFPLCGFFFAKVFQNHKLSWLGFAGVYLLNFFLFANVSLEF